jgi:hypothetical protein
MLSSAVNRSAPTFSEDIAVVQFELHRSTGAGPQDLAPTPLSAFASLLADPEASWSVGGFGAIAEFARAADEPADRRAPLRIVTPRGALALVPDAAARPVAYETVSAAPGAWNHALAFCLPADACAMAGRTRITELGPDEGACRPQDRRATLFDLGLGTLQLDACVRTADPALIAELRNAQGRALFDHGNPVAAALVRHGPHRVFVCRLGRIEVFQPIPPADGRSPDGPHTHVLPKLLARGRTHAATAPIPGGWVPCMHAYPAHPAKGIDGTPRPFDAARHESFQALLRRHGAPDLVALKDRVTDAIAREAAPGSFPPPRTRAQRAALRVCLRQLAARGAAPAAVAAWRAAFDPAGAART